MERGIEREREREGQGERKSWSKGNRDGDGLRESESREVQGRYYKIRKEQKMEE